MYILTDQLLPLLLATISFFYKKMIMNLNQHKTLTLFLSSSLVSIMYAIYLKYNQLTRLKI